MKKILFGITWFLSSFVLMVYISYIERSKDNNILEDFLYKNVVLTDNIVIIYIGVAIPFVAFYMFFSKWFSTPKNQRKDLFKSIEDKLFLSVKVIDETTLKFKSNYSKDEEFERKWKDGKIHDIIKEFKKELKDKKIEKTNGFKIEFLNEHDFVRKDDVDIRIKIVEKDEKEILYDEKYEELIHRIEETYLEFEEVENENRFIFSGNLDDEESNFYRKYKDNFSKYKDNLDIEIKQFGLSEDFKVKIVEKTKKEGNFILVIDVFERVSFDNENFDPQMKNMCDEIQLYNRKGEYPEIIDYKVDENNQAHYHYEKFPTLTKQNWNSKLPIVRNITNKNPEIKFHKDNVEIALYDDLPTADEMLEEYGFEYYLDFLKEGHVFVGFNHRMEKQYIKLSDMTFFCFSGNAGSGKGILMTLMEGNSTYLIHSKEVAHINILDPKGDELAHFENLNDPDIHLYLGYEKIPQFVFDLELEFEGRRIYKNEGNARVITIASLNYFDEFDQVNTLGCSPEVSEYVYDFLLRAMALGRSYGVKVFLTSQSLTVDTIPVKMRGLFEDRALARTKEQSHANVLFGNSECYNSLGYDDLSNLKNGQFVAQASQGAFKENVVFQAPYSDTSPKGKEPCYVYKKAYKKGLEELANGDLNENRDFERMMQGYREKALLEMYNNVDTPKWKMELFIVPKMKEYGLLDETNNVDFDDVVLKGNDVKEDVEEVQLSDNDLNDIDSILDNFKKDREEEEIEIKSKYDFL